MLALILFCGLAFSWIGIPATSSIYPLADYFLSEPDGTWYFQESDISSRPALSSWLRKQLVADKQVHKICGFK